MKTVLYALLIFIAAAASANATTVSGTISLPAGVVAGSGGAEINVRAFVFVFDGSFDSANDSVVIAEGESSVSYSFELPEPSAVETFRVRFECTSGCTALGVSNTGFWNTDIGISGIIRATDFDASADNRIDILLERADIFSGVVNLPDGLIATGNESISVTIGDSATFSFTSFSASGTLLEGSTQMPFSIAAPNANARDSWVISVSCRGCQEPIFDEFTILYTTELQGDPLSTVQSDRIFYPFDNDYTDLVLTLLAVEPPRDSDKSVITPVLKILLDDER